MPNIENCLDADKGTRMEIAATLVLYHPGQDTIGKVIHYTQFLDFLTVVDNTVNSDLSARFLNHPKIKYVAQGINSGIATALNVGAVHAIEEGHSWLLMLDQDSTLTEETYLRIKQQIFELTAEDIGLVAPLQVSKLSDLNNSQPNASIRDVGWVMTSGCALNLKAYLECGPFEDKLFIDHVDHEYCLRMGQNGYRSIQNPRIVLDHSLGEPKETKILGWKPVFISHKPFRSYYFVRNGLYVALKYSTYSPKFAGWVLFQILKNILKAAFLDDQKLLRFKMMIWGFVDFCNGRYGAADVIRGDNFQ